MKNYLFVLSLVLFASCSPVTYDVFSTITGTVVDEQTKDPINGVSVILSPSGKNSITGSDGYFEFQDLEAGQYTLTVQATGYSTNRKTVTVVPGEVEQISMTMKKLE